MKSVSITELMARFGPAVEVKQYGQSLIIQGSEFDPDWEVLLADQEFEVHYETLDGHPVTVVPLKVLGNEVKNVEKVTTYPKNRNSPKGPAWTTEDEQKLLKFMGQLPGTIKERCERLAPEFERSPIALKLKFSILQGKRQGRVSEEVKSVPEKPKEVPVKVEPADPDDKQAFMENEDAVKDIADNIGWYVDNRQAEVEEKLQILSEAYDALSKAFVELKADFEKKSENLIKWAFDEFAENLEFEEFKQKLVKHKHAVSGETMIPLEASS